MSPADAASNRPPRLALVMPAAGNSRRMGGARRKPLLELHGIPIIAHTLERFQPVGGIQQAVIVAHPDDVPTIRTDCWAQLAALGATDLVPGGARRQDSVARGLAALRPDIDLVLIHDAVRPFVPRRAIDEAVRMALEHGAAIVAMPVPDTVKRADGDGTRQTVPRADLWGAQTPQVFRLELIRRALEAADREGFECTDDAQLVERLGHEVKLVRGSYQNFKITTPDHLRMAEALLSQPGRDE